MMAAQGQDLFPLWHAEWLTCVRCRASTDPVRPTRRLSRFRKYRPNNRPANNRWTHWCSLLLFSSSHRYKPFTDRRDRGVFKFYRSSHSRTAEFRLSSSSPTVVAPPPPQSLSPAPPLHSCPFPPSCPSWPASPALIPPLTWISLQPSSVALGSKDTVSHEYAPSSGNAFPAPCQTPHI